MKRQRRLRAIAIAPLAAAVAVALLAPAASAAVKFQIPGRGYGHGVGMSQWGAYGLAKAGKGHKRILKHYYRGTKLKRTKPRRVRVLLSTRPRAVRFSRAKRACGRKLGKRRTYRARLSRNGRKVRLEQASGKKIKSCGRKLGAKGAGPIRISGDGRYRGNLVVRPSGGGLNVINAVDVDKYLRGVVPGEVPASWPGAALRAQAVAARSYALATGRDGDGFDHYDDTRSQVYAGVGIETKATNRAVRRTSRQVVTSRGKIAATFFFASSGGRTENVEFGFPGSSPRRYLKSVRDPFDKAAPEHRWRVTYSRAQMQSKLDGLVKGRLRRIKITKTGRSPRIVRARIIGSGGRTAVSGDDLRFRLGLRSTWVKFKKVRR